MLLLWIESDPYSTAERGEVIRLKLFREAMALADLAWSPIARLRPNRERDARYLYRGS
jgi:hypothetical protein